MLTVREQTQKDQQKVLSLIRQAFWNLYQPGANQHFLYMLIKKQKSFIPELCLVAEQNGIIVGQIIGYKTKIKNEQKEFETITFGPVSVDASKQGQGIGQYLIRFFFQKARQIGYKAVIIQGYPHFYNKLGFVNSKIYNVSDEQGNFSAGLLVYELEKGYLSDKSGVFVNSIDHNNINQQQLDQFDKEFQYKEKFETKSQDYFMKMIEITQEDPEPENIKDMWNRQKKV